jgi:alkanesulfonate monooxygenase SsuD/methylene tetrahydromethanopterin reductase-like flavin-dependent oxidoreductase (luciferase family)
MTPEAPVARSIAPDRTLGFGVVAGLAPDLLTALAREVSSLGYGAFWINDSGRADADGLAGLAVVAAAAPALDLGVGVMPLDQRSPAAIADEVRHLGLPLDRLRLGVGSGGEQHRPLGLVRDGVGALREGLPGARIVVSALGPRMSELAGEIADGVLFNWAVPERLAANGVQVDEGALETGRAHVERWTYVRTAVGADARSRIGAEAAKYARSPAYGRTFEAMGVPLDEIGLPGDAIVDQLPAYRHAVDGVVIRALPVAWTLEDVATIARAAAPWQHRR